jgi:hypothetical protein
LWEKEEACSLRCLKTLPFSSFVFDFRDSISIICC